MRRMSEPNNIIPIKQPPGKEPECSFCKKPKSKVRMLIEGSTGARICNECVMAAKARIAQ